MRVFLCMLFISFSFLVKSQVFTSIGYDFKNEKGNMMVGFKSSIISIGYTVRSNSYKKNRGLEAGIPIRHKKVIVEPYFYKPWFYSEIYSTGESVESDELDFGIRFYYKIDNKLGIMIGKTIYNNEKFDYFSSSFFIFL